jgi:hypothetical protein
MILISTFTVAGSKNPELQVDELVNTYDVLDDIKIKENNNNSSYFFKTAGPRMWYFSKMRIVNGSIIDKELLLPTIVLNIIVRIIFLSYPLLRPLIFTISEDNKIDFTLEYKRDIDKGNLSRYRYKTEFGRLENGNFTDENTSFYNEKHSVKVEGFYGALLTTKRCTLLSSTLVMSGYCDNVTLIDS